jgi:GTPase SAR1 family protein
VSEDPDQSCEKMIDVRFGISNLAEAVKSTVDGIEKNILAIPKKEDDATVTALKAAFTTGEIELHVVEWQRRFPLTGWASRRLAGDPHLFFFCASGEPVASLDAVQQEVFALRNDEIAFERRWDVAHHPATTDKAGWSYARHQLQNVSSYTASDEKAWVRQRIHVLRGAATIPAKEKLSGLLRAGVRWVGEDHSLDGEREPSPLPQPPEVEQPVDPLPPLTSVSCDPDSKEVLKSSQEPLIDFSSSYTGSHDSFLGRSISWMDDANVLDCCGCKRKFSLILRRHHCRACGKIFCSQCCPATRAGQDRRCLGCFGAASNGDLLNSFVLAGSQRASSVISEQQPRIPRHNSVAPSAEPSVIALTPTERLVAVEARTRTDVVEECRSVVDGLIMLMNRELFAAKEFAAVTERQKFCGKLSLSAALFTAWSGGSLTTFSLEMSARCGDAICKSIPVGSPSTPGQLKEGHLLLSGASTELELSVSAGGGNKPSFFSVGCSANVDLKTLIPTDEFTDSDVNMKLFSCSVIFAKEASTRFETTLRCRFERSTPAVAEMRAAERKLIDVRVVRWVCVDEPVARLKLWENCAEEITALKSFFDEEKKSAESRFVRRLRLERATVKAEATAQAEKQIFMARTMEIWFHFVQMSGAQRNLRRAKAVLEDKVSAGLLAGVKFAMGAASKAANVGSDLTNVVENLADRSNALEHLHRATNHLSKLRSDLTQTASRTDQISADPPGKSSSRAATSNASCTESSDRRPIKIVCVGDPGVGKTSIITQLTKNVFSDCPPVTIGVDSHKCCLLGQAIQIMEAPGGLQLSSLPPQFYRGSSAVLIVVDATNAESWHKSSIWWQRDAATKVGSTAFHQIPIFLIANKADLLSESSPNILKLTDFRAHHHFSALLVTSAKNNSSVTAAFKMVLDEVASNNYGAWKPRSHQALLLTNKKIENKKQAQC